MQYNDVDYNAQFGHLPRVVIPDRRQTHLPTLEFRNKINSIRLCF